MVPTVYWFKKCMFFQKSKVPRKVRYIQTMQIVDVECTFYQGPRRHFEVGGATVNSEKFFFKNSQNLLNKSQKVGGAIAPPPARALLLVKKM